MTAITYRPKPKPGPLQVHEVAKLWRVSPMTVYRLVKSGELRSTRIGRGFRISLADVEQYERDHTTGTS